MSIIILQLCEEFVIAQLATQMQHSLKNFAWETSYEKITQFPSGCISWNHHSTTNVCEEFVAQLELTLNSAWKN